MRNILQDGFTILFEFLLLFLHIQIFPLNKGKNSRKELQEFAH